jgi:hypothetical protein
MKDTLTIIGGTRADEVIEGDKQVITIYKLCTGSISENKIVIFTIINEKGQHNVFNQDTMRDIYFDFLNEDTME